MPRADLEAVQAAKTQAQQPNERRRSEGTFYDEQVQAYWKRFPKNTSYFSKYVASAPPAPASK